MDKKPGIIDLIEDDDWIKKEVKPLITPQVTSQSNNVILVNSNKTSQVPTVRLVPPPQLSSWINPSIPFVQQQYKSPKGLAASTSTEVKRAKTKSDLGNNFVQGIAKDEKVDVNVLTVEYKGVKYGVSGIVMLIMMSRLVPTETIKVEVLDSEEDSEGEEVGAVSSTHCSISPSLSPATSASSSDASKPTDKQPYQYLVGLFMKMADMYQPKTLADWRKMREDYNKVFNTDFNEKSLRGLANQCRKLIRETKGVQPWDLEITMNTNDKNRKEYYREQRKRKKLMNEQMSMKSKPEANMESTKEMTMKSEVKIESEKLKKTEEEKLRKIQDYNLRMMQEEKVKKMEEEKLLKEKTEKDRIEKMVLEILNKEKAEKEKVDAEARKVDAAKKRLEFVKKKREQLLAKSLEPPKFNFLLKRPEK